ncbi:hypothetical protein PENTCL1PPCAC_29394 [Pristionchus entomophagus]|uniref:Uncharacterized protein n=1 Tax=Pristionchus entomophagus TaxID=358040 RepID=A0AAV5UJJ3_9BILA|nr:hypothetical protein PENTCL1PPCAC_29394 [Pristionchus entomophagus]
MRLLLLAALVGAASAFCPNEVFHNQTACSCSDYFDGAVVKCSGPEGPMIVEKLKSTHVEIRELVLEKANIIEIGPRAFKNLRIKKLVLDQNRIKSFHKNAFDGLQNCLQELSIAHNRLTKIPTDALNGLRGLNVLNLRCNRIQDLEESVFQNVTSVMDINLSCNQICSINGTAFESIRSSIQSLTLDNNCLTEFPAEAVANMDNLIAFHAKTNLINELAANDVTNLTSLSILVLTGNNISLVHPEAVHGCPNLRYVYLAENSLSTFENGAMSQFEHAQVVDLSFNYIKKVEADTFSGLESLQHINLESNQVSEIAPGAFSGTPLLLLWLPNNCISNVTAAMFQGAPFLRQVSLANNNINDIEPLSFAHLANLHTLDLAYNRIMELRNNAISGSDYLTVRLQENPMICEDESYHVMNGAEPVYLTGEPNIICKGNWKMLPAPVCPQGVPRPLPSPCCQKDQGRASKLPSTTTTAAPESEELPDYGEEGSGEDEEEEEEEDAKTNVVKGPAPVADVPLVKVVAPNTTTAAAAPAPAKTTAKPVHRKVVEEEVLEDETEEIEDEEEEEEEENDISEAPVTTTVAATTTTTAQVTTASTIPSVAAQQSKSRKVNMERFLRLANKGKFEDAIKKKSVFHLPASEQKKLAGVPAKKIVYEEEEEEGKEEGEDEKKIVAQEVEFSKDPRVGEEEEVEYEEGEAEGEEYEEEEEETPAPTTTTTTTTTTVAPRRVPARLLDRKLNRGRMLPPWMRNRHMSKEKTSAPVESAEFSHDSQVQTVQVAERIPII